MKSIIVKKLALSSIDERVLSPVVVRLMGSIKLSKNFDYKKDLGRALINKYR
jgi:hypothetical protein